MCSQNQLRIAWFRKLLKVVGNLEKRIVSIIDEVKKEIAGKK